ncbi:lytic transglycosylase domain-containing protein [Marivibrio halodurans]|uniref:Lytic transglycosylase domain-containing protein n=1 Tax=Marivibrio halodurans TaxID=2039722 RepID=A0A8J7S394_9PROT|nr:lytic transglycosylase domain-containing protein [Marivibrio halodurans]MBP5855879.1 lytic transglycosylase domain-containing protein [Marivibrio halodurans]
MLPTSIATAALLLVLTFIASDRIARADALPAALTEDDAAEYELAFRALDRGRWEAALRHAGRAEEDLPRQAVIWLCHQSLDCPSSFGEITRFVETHPAWPRLDRLRRRAEEALGHAVPDARILDWFAAYPPLTSVGTIHYLRALERTGDRPRLRREARAIWRTTLMGYSDEHEFRQRYRDLLSDQDEIDRLEWLLWEGHVESATRQARRVPRAYRDLAEARILLRTMRGGVDAAIARVVPDLADHPGLVYERLRWRRKKGRDEEAGNLLRWPEMQTVRPDLWWQERAILARRAFSDGEISRAYRLAADHGTNDGADFAEAEWFAGWVALRFLRDPEMAFPHFRRMFERVSYPVSLSRAAYWAGRAAENGGKPEVAHQWYAEAAKHSSSFYGQIAALKLPAGERPGLPVEPNPTATQVQAFESGQMVKLIRMLQQVGAEDTVRVFIDHMSENLNDPINFTLLAGLARDIGRNDLAVRVSREAIKDGVILSGTGYPALDMDGSQIADTTIVHGLIRQESGFDIDAESHAGARGLMQLMPATARVVARRENLRYERDKLTAEPQFNLHLGTAYLKSLLERFDGYLPLALAAYNAGPNRARRWAEEFGDPRGMTLEDQIDWIESIPYPETRNYVQRVMEGITVYRQRAAGRHVALRLTSAAGY